MRRPYSPLADGGRGATAAPGARGALQVVVRSVPAATLLQVPAGGGLWDPSERVRPDPAGELPCFLEARQRQVRLARCGQRVESPVRSEGQRQGGPTLVPRLRVAPRHPSTDERA